MAHKAMMNGTAYEITGGKAMMNGAVYNVDSGKTVSGGTVYPISFVTIPALNEATWELIREISDAGQAANCWAIGDRKEVTLNGTVGSATFSNETYYCYIIGIDHNSNIEGTNRIHFQFGYSALSGGTHLAFVDSKYNKSAGSGYYFSMTNTTANNGGWNSSRMRTVICPEFKNTMPSDLQAVLKTVTKYSDNIGNSVKDESNVTATTDEIFLLAEYEIFSTANYANSAEQNYQAQYAYYSAGNSKVRYNHSDTGTVINWWTRSVSIKNSLTFCSALTSGVSGYGYTYYSRGFAPAFCV